MSKKVFSVILAITMIAAMLCVGTFFASADEAVHTGDQVRYIFSIAPLTDVGGLTVNSTYDASKLTYVSSEYVYADGMGAVNDLNAGAVSWNDTFATGLSTSNTDIFAITYNVTADGDVSSFGLSSNCVELFDVNAIDFPGDFNSLVTARVEVIHNETSDSEDFETNTEDYTTETDTETDTESDTSSTTSNTSSANTSSANTSSANTSSVKTDTPEPTSSTSSATSSTSSNTSSTISSGSSSAANSSSNPGTSSNSNKNNSSSVDTVKTAGTVAIISLVVVLMAAAAIVFFSKKNAAE